VRIAGLNRGSFSSKVLHNSDQEMFMIFFQERILRHSIAITASVEEVWDFFEHLDRNYKSWHPESHIACRWIKGRPHEVGSVAYFEEVLHGKLCKIKIRCTHVEKHKCVECKPFFPLSIFHPKAVYLFESTGSQCIFSAVNHMRIPRLFNRAILSLVEATERHMEEEGENLKKLIEK